MIGWSPLKYQSNSGPTSSFSSAIKPSTEVTACITTVLIAPSYAFWAVVGASLRETAGPADSHRSRVHACSRVAISAGSSAVEAFHRLLAADPPQGVGKVVNQTPDLRGCFRKEAA